MAHVYLDPKFRYPKENTGQLGLLDAVSKQDAGRIQFLLPFASQTDISHAFFYTCFHGSLDTAILISGFLRKDACDQELFQHALIEMSKRGDTERLTLILNFCDQEKDYITSLWVAAQTDHLAAVELLIPYADLYTDYGTTLLLTMLRQEKNDIAYTLLPHVTQFARNEALLCAVKLDLRDAFHIIYPVAEPKVVFGSMNKYSSSFSDNQFNMMQTRMKVDSDKKALGSAMASKKSMSTQRKM